MTLLKPMAYQNTYALAVKKSFADEHQLKKISDLAAVSDQIKADSHWNLLIVPMDIKEFKKHMD